MWVTPPQHHSDFWYVLLVTRLRESRGNKNDKIFEIKKGTEWWQWLFSLFHVWAYFWKGVVVEGDGSNTEELGVCLRNNFLRCCQCIIYLPTYAAVPAVQNSPGKFLLQLAFSQTCWETELEGQAASGGSLPASLWFRSLSVVMKCEAILLELSFCWRDWFNHARAMRMSNINLMPESLSLGSILPFIVSELLMTMCAFSITHFPWK